MTKGSTSVSYKYNDSGIRTSKRVNGIDHIYTLNGSQIVSESWGDVTLIYLYDENGSPLGFRYRTTSMTEGVFVNFYFEKNLFGDIVAVYNEAGVKVLSYSYDAWGNHTTTRNNSAGNNMYAMHNPFRYRGYYYDTETGFYYLQSRYYNPQWGRFLNIDAYISTGKGLIGYNMVTYCINNPIKYLDDTGYDIVELDDVVGDQVDEKEGGSTATPIVIGGQIIGGGRISTSNRKEKERAYFSGETNTSAVNGSSVCFKEGTPVAAAAGLIAIEDIEVGDLVWATNPETGETELKQVVQTFINEASELVHLTTSGETITATPTHPFYVPEKGWVSAIDLRAGDILVTVNGEYVVLEKVQHEILESPVTVYNFEVEGFHTYHVGQTNILVHNDCKPKSPSKVSDNYINSNNIDAHAFKNKAAKIPKNQISKYDIYKDTANKGKLWVGDKAGKIWKETKYFFEDLTTFWRK